MRIWRFSFSGWKFYLPKQSNHSLNNQEQNGFNWIPFHLRLESTLSENFYAIPLQHTFPMKPFECQNFARCASPQGFHSTPKLWNIIFCKVTETVLLVYFNLCIWWSEPECDVPVPGIFHSFGIGKNGTGKSPGTGIGEIWYRKKVSEPVWENLVPEKVSEPVSEKFGTGTDLRRQ